MTFEDDRLELQRLAGGNIVQYPPVFGDNGSFLFVRSVDIVQVYSTSTGELTRELTGAKAPLISCELELKQPEVLVACTNTGELLRWHWRTGVLQKTLQLHLPHEGQVVACCLLNMYRQSPTACAWIMTKPSGSRPINWAVVDTTTGRKLIVPLDLILKSVAPIIEVCVGSYPYIVLAQGFYVYFINYKTWRYVRYKHPNTVPVTCMRFNPVEEMVATGDEMGRIFLWRQFSEQRTMRNALFHWHHTPVTSIAFSGDGTTLFSSGHEAVLVKWNVAQPNQRHFLPRMTSVIRHVVVSEGNEHVVLSTDDNGMQFVSSDSNTLKNTVQNFTYAPDDKTGRPKFPIGLRLNPRSNTLVLNGRMGQLQFYSAYTKNLLYNLAIVDENKLSMEVQSILYNIQVTKAAFNIDWMATGEVFNDEEHMPALCLKFWKYNESLQRYVLNTNIELPHEGGFKAMAFSNDYQVDHLLCATVGNDNIIKMWSLEQSDNIYRTGKIWCCVAQTSYKQMPIEAISFAQDGSLLAAGYGNTLCIYKADTLKLRVALTGTSGMDGTLAKAQVRLAKQTVNGAKKEYAEQRNKLWLLFKRVLDTNDATLIKEIQATLQSKHLRTDASKVADTAKVSDTCKAQIFAKIQQTNQLNLYQKLLLMQQFGIECEVQPQWRSRMVTYLQNNTVDDGTTQRAQKLADRLQRVNVRQLYKAKYRLAQFAKRKLNVEQEISQQLLPIMSMLNLTEITKPATAKSPKQKNKPSTANTTSASAGQVQPVLSFAEIRHLQFAAGEHAHLVTVCTETRVLIWNMLTLRLQSVLKLSVKHLAFDPQTNLLAAVTKNNELHVFQPNVPLPIYQRANLPKLHGLIWLPRRYPRQRSIDVDWQAQSTLYFLTESQEIKYLVDPDATAEIELPAPIAFAQSATSESMRYATFGTYASQQLTSKTKDTKHQHRGPLIVGKDKDSAVSALVALSAHTMPPLSMLCGEFVKSLLTPAETTTRHEANTSSNGTNGLPLTNGAASHTDSEAEDESMAERDVTMRGHDEETAGTLASTSYKTSLAVRRAILQRSAEADAHANKSLLEDMESKLERIAKVNFSLDF